MDHDEDEEIEEVIRGIKFKLKMNVAKEHYAMIRKTQKKIENGDEIYKLLMINA
jgi:hypothetical protein